MLLKGFNDNKGDNKLELLELLKDRIIIIDNIISEIPVTRIIVIKVDFLIFLFLLLLLLFLSTRVIWTLFEDYN